MQGLLFRLSTLDADAESAVRVIAYFDSLLRDHVSVPVLLAATARLAQCPVGLFDAATGRRTRTSPSGAVDTPATSPAEVRELSSELGSVWMEREGPAHGLDEIVLERYAAAAEVTLERAAALAQAGQDPALVELVLSAETGEAERARALRLLGFAPSAPLQALAIALPDQGLAAGLRAMGHQVREARIGDTEAVLVARLGDEATSAVRALCLAGSIRGAATAMHLHHSSMAARIARAESALGFSLADAPGRLRAHLALALVRLRANPATGRTPV
ncbi:helix-turn-helix domain-containing protein [Nonomuraea sp. 3N208]|uniref:helix-turn-helix domain-containing protein n=1 Tax=Nonomuraea sp. 3N208 TaxID=3457421 RepID=UPI003FCE71C9